MTNRLNITKEMKQKDIKYAVKKLTASDVVCMHIDCDSNQLHMVLASAKEGVEVHYTNESGMQCMSVPADMPNTTSKVKAYMNTKEEVTMKPVDQLTVAENVQQVMENPDAVLEMNTISEKAKDLNTLSSAQPTSTTIESNNEKEESTMTQVKVKAIQVKERIVSSKFVMSFKSSFSKVKDLSSSAASKVKTFIKRNWKQAIVGTAIAYVAGLITPGAVSAFLLGTAAYATYIYFKGASELKSANLNAPKVILIPSSIILASAHIALGTVIVLGTGLVASLLTAVAGVMSYTLFASIANVILA
ncbi:hypothetical protein P4I85_14190 [Bacillus cereus]|uniref:hypothetical protein n=1 Tax=Bacillus thuringiensis TaxID=1428 RepID=UPI001298CF94|nr:hypothetical protein [Bacillus thuringiensis]MDR5047771.1 hypothetical protein [Bacillus thuringiensis]MEB9509549.1 hypothetical protein [Bacillus cereus]MEB9561641.1 hypothetical protein [Bacillus cereus]MRC02961.1 hypothetical protein [Bacillus thuringiensis]